MVIKYADCQFNDFHSMDHTLYWGGMVIRYADTSSSKNFQLNGPDCVGGVSDDA